MAKNKEPNPFDPAENPNFEYLPYHEDPTIQWFMRQNTDGSALLQETLWNWERARDESTRDPYSVDKILDMNAKKATLDKFLEDNEIRRSVRERPPEQ